MTNLIISIADAKDTATDIIKLLEFASILWDENTEELSNRCIKVTHKAAELVVCFALYLMNDGTIAKASEEVLEEMGEVRVGESAKVIQIFVEAFLQTFTKVHDIKVTFVKSLEELKVIAKSLKVPSYASFRSVDKIQAAIDKKISAMV